MPAPITVFSGKLWSFGTSSVFIPLVQCEWKINLLGFIVLIEVYMLVPDEIMVRYFERRKRDVEDCIQHLKSGDMRFIEKVGHQLKGNGVTFGFPELSTIGTELEMAAQSGDTSVVSRAVGKLSDWVEVHLS